MSIITATTATIATGSTWMALRRRLLLLRRDVVVDRPLRCRNSDFVTAVVRPVTTTTKTVSLLRTTRSAPSSCSLVSPSPRRRTASSSSNKNDVGSGSGSEGNDTGEKKVRSGENGGSGGGEEEEASAAWGFGFLAVLVGIPAATVSRDYYQKMRGESSGQNSTTWY